MDIIQLLKYGSPGILLGLIILRTTQGNKIDELCRSIERIEKSLEDMKNSITWGDTCEKLHAEINRRLERVENRQNGLK